MLYKLICAALLISSGEALKVSTGVSRRAALAKAASIALPMAASPAFALVRDGDADIYKRADEGKLTATRAIERAKSGDLADGTSATCDELDKLIAVDRETDLIFESIQKLELMDAEEKQNAKTTREVLKNQVKKLQKRKDDKGCGESDITNAKAILDRSRAGGLKDDYVISRAKQGELLGDKVGMDKVQVTCKDLADIQKVDDLAMMKINAQASLFKKKAAQLEKDGDVEGAKKALVQAEENKLLLKRIASTETQITSVSLQKMCTY